MLITIHSGEHLAEELEALDMSAKELARKLDVPTNRVTQVLNGTRAIRGDTALRFAHFFGTSAEFWLNLQSLYELRLAQRVTHGTVSMFKKQGFRLVAPLSSTKFSSNVLIRRTIRSSPVGISHATRLFGITQVQTQPPTPQTATFLGPRKFTREPIAVASAQPARPNSALLNPSNPP